MKVGTISRRNFKDVQFRLHVVVPKINVSVVQDCLNCVYAKFIGNNNQFIIFENN